MKLLSILSHKQKLWLRKFAKQNSIKLDIRALSGILYAWMDNFHSLSRNYFQHLHTAEAKAQLASIAILLNKL